MDVNNKIALGFFAVLHLFYFILENQIRVVGNDRVL